MIVGQRQTSFGHDQVVDNLFSTQSQFIVDVRHERIDKSVRLR